MPTVEIQVIDGAGRALPPGDVGEICIKVPIIMKGYGNKPEATAETIVDGWLRSGDAAVIGVPHAELGEEVKAVVQVEADHDISEAEVKQWAADGLANFTVPAYVEIQTHKLPRNASGKLSKNLLRGDGVVSFEETV